MSITERCQQTVSHQDKAACVGARESTSACSVSSTSLNIIFLGGTAPTATRAGGAPPGAMDRQPYSSSTETIVSCALTYAESSCMAAKKAAWMRRCTAAELRTPGAKAGSSR